MDFCTFDKWMQFVVAESKGLQQRAHARPLGYAAKSDEVLEHLITTVLSSLTYLLRIEHPHLLRDAVHAFVNGEGITVGRNKLDEVPRQLKSITALYEYIIEMRR